MSRVVLVVCVLYSGLLIQSTEVAKGDPPDVITPYLFLPRHSTLEQTGGIAGVDIRYEVYGTFDLVTGWEYVSDPPPISIQPYAKFENVDAWASNPLLDSLPLNLDQILNLSGLQGSQLPVAAPFDVYQFEGKTADGSAVNLYASLLGPWLYLRGGTEPPVGGADYFTYQISALARQRPFADFNLDGAVDGRDFLTWASNYGLATTAAVDLQNLGDANEDGVVDGLDYLVWASQYGETAPDVGSLDAMLNSALATLPAASSVPEPATLPLLILAAAVWCFWRRRAA